MVIGVFENENDIKAVIKDKLLSFSFHNNVDFDVLWFDNLFRLDNLEKYIEPMCVAFISLDNKYFSDIGRIISKRNPMCYICYYSKSEKDLYSLLKTRPYEFTITSFLDEKAEKTVQEIYDCILSSESYYTYRNKSVIWSCPIRSIDSFQSDLKYVFAVFDSNKEIKMRTTLDMIEKNLEQRKIRNKFIRIHKSYLVNIEKIRSISKKEHTVEMENDNIFPISDAKYNEVLEFWKNR